MADGAAPEPLDPEAHGPALTSAGQRLGHGYFFFPRRTGLRAVAGLRRAAGFFPAARLAGFRADARAGFFAALRAGFAADALPDDLAAARRAGLRAATGGA